MANAVAVAGRKKCAIEARWQERHEIRRCSELKKSMKWIHCDIFSVFSAFFSMNTLQASIQNEVLTASRPDASSCPYSAFACLRERSERKQASRLGAA